MNSPINLALDRKRGLLYVADYENLRVRQINLQTGIIRLVAGNGKLPFTAAGPDDGSVGMSPNGVAVASDGTLYISDDANNCIYKVVVATGALSVIASAAAMKIEVLERARRVGREMERERPELRQR